MSDSYLIDSNILLRISSRRDADYPPVAATMERLLRQGANLYYTHQNIAEFWNVWTRPAHKNGFGLSVETAKREIEKFETMMEFLADSRSSYEKWRQLVSDYDVTGVQVHDARLVAAMLVHGIPKLLTLNIDDFARYGDLILAVRPDSSSYPL